MPRPVGGTGTELVQILPFSPRYRHSSRKGCADSGRCRVRCGLCAQARGM